MDTRAPSWGVSTLLCLLLVLALSIESQGHAGCNHDHGHEHDHSHEGWNSQGFSPVQDDGHGHDHGHAHHHAHQKHSHTHQSHSHGHGHDHKHGADRSHGRGYAKKVDDSDQKWRPAEEMAEERELREFGFEEEIDDFDESDISSIGSLDVGLWLRAMGSSLAVSLASLICLMLIPFIPYGGGMPSRTFVDSLAAFGVGAMLGDAFLHQLPHAFGSGGHNHVHGDHDHGHDHGHEGHEHEHGTGSHGHTLAELSVGLSVLVGILLFFIVEKIVRAVEAETHKGKMVPFSGGHQHHHHSPKQKHVKGEAEKEEDKKDEKAPAEAKEEEEKGKNGGGGGGEEDSNGGEEKDEVEDGFVLASAKGEESKKGGKGKVKGLKQRKNAGTGDAQSTPAAPADAGADVSAATSLAAPAESASEGEKKRKKKNKKAKEEDVPDVVPEAAATSKSQKDSKLVKKEEPSQAVEKEGGSSMMVLGYLNLFSDGVHNFTDGMSLGAAFLHHGTLGGYSRMLFMLAHELPQEVGDFGILLRAGFSVFRALAFNFLSALMAMAGTAFALLLGGNPGHSSIIEGFTAGGFIYIAVAGVMPDMHSSGTGLRATLLQLFAMAAGMAVAVGISLME